MNAVPMTPEELAELENARINAQTDAAACLQDKLHRMTLEKEGYRIQAES